MLAHGKLFFILNDYKKKDDQSPCWDFLMENMACAPDRREKESMHKPEGSILI